MSARTADPTIAAALERYRRGAELLQPAVRELQAALRLLERHPDYLETLRAREEWERRTDALRKRKGWAASSLPFAPHLTLAYWLHNCIHGLMHDTPVGEGPAAACEDLADDGAAVERSMLLAIETEARDLACFAARRRRRAGARRAA